MYNLLSKTIWLWKRWGVYLFFSTGVGDIIISLITIVFFIKYFPEPHTASTYILVALSNSLSWLLVWFWAIKRKWEVL